MEDDRIGVLGITQLPVPKPNVPGVIELHGDYLHWSGTTFTPEAIDQTEIRLFPSAKSQTETIKQVPVYKAVNTAEKVDSTGALDRFARLRTATDILRFARQYGVLEFCQHGVPYTHNPRFLSIPLMGLVQSPSLWFPIEADIDGEPGFLIQGRGERPWCEPLGIEAIEGWLFWSRMAAALLNVTAAFEGDRPTRRDDWECVITEEIDKRTQLIDMLVARSWAGRVYLQEAVNRWLRLGAVRLALRWPIGVDKAFLELETGTYGILGVQLLAAVTGAQTLSICDGCGTPYIREGRRPQVGRANYCPDCRANKVPEKMRQRRKRDKDRRSTSVAKERQLKA